MNFWYKQLRIGIHNRPICRSPPLPILHSYWLAQRPPTQSRLWPPAGVGGDWYYITTCRKAEGTKDPCISHIDASHGEWPRIESSLLFLYLFYIVKIIEKSLFYEPEIGFIGKITYWRRIRYFFLIFWHLRHFRAISFWKKQGPFHPWSFWWGLKIRALNTYLGRNTYGNISDDTKV